MKINHGWLGLVLAMVLLTGCAYGVTPAGFERPSETGWDVARI